MLRLLPACIIFEEVFFFFYLFADRKHTSIIQLLRIYLDSCVCVFAVSSRGQSLFIQTFNDWPVWAFLNICAFWFRSRNFFSFTVCQLQFSYYYRRDYYYLDVCVLNTLSTYTHIYITGKQNKKKNAPSPFC